SPRSKTLPSEYPCPLRGSRFNALEIFSGKAADSRSRLLRVKYPWVLSAQNGSIRPQLRAGPAYNKPQGASLAIRFEVSSARSGLRPNGFCSRPGQSDWASSALPFLRVHIVGVRQLVAARPWWLAARVHFGGSSPHYVPVLANRAGSKTHFALRARWAKFYRLKC